MLCAPTVCLISFFSINPFLIMMTMASLNPIASHPFEPILQRLANGDGLLPESEVNLLEVMGILESYGHVIDDYQINLRYIADQQFLVLFPFFKYMNGDVTFKRLLQHWQHDRINYEFSEYCMKAMMYHGGGGLDAYLDTPEFIELANRAIAAKTKNNFIVQGFNKLSSEFLLEQVRQMCYYRALGQFWNIMADMFLKLADRYHRGEIKAIRDVIHHVRDGLVAAAGDPIYYSVEINDQTYDIIPKSAGLTFLVDTAIPYVEAVFFRSLPFMGILSYNAQAQQLPADQAEFIYGALYADPIPAGSAGVPPSLLARDLVRHMPDYLMDYYRTFSRGTSDLSVKSIVSFQKSMFCVTSGAILGLTPNPLDSTDPKAQQENRKHFVAWVDRLINSGSRLEAVQTN
jgi:CO2 hydration protein